MKMQERIDAEKTKNLAAGGKFRLEDIPIKKFYDQAQYLDNSLLPAIEKKNGRDSEDYKYFAEVYKSLLYAVCIVERNNSLILKIQHTNQFNALLQTRVDIAERELLKYSTMEDLILTGAMDHIAAGVTARVKDLLK